MARQRRIDPRQRVLGEDYQISQNFYESDVHLQQLLHEQLSQEVLDRLKPKLYRMGFDAAVVMDALSLQADQHGPVLRKRSPLGEERDQIEFHPSYWELMDIAAQSEMFYLKYQKDQKEHYEGYRHRAGFAIGQLYAMSELGQYCPLCMTDGAALVLERHGDPALAKRLLPRLSSREGDDLYTGAMFLTERRGGSDVGRNVTTAKSIDRHRYQLNGEKWFCSNANAEVKLVLARTDEEKKGTRGLSLFVVENERADGSPNPMEIVRLKDKMGVRSMASAEIILNDTQGWLIGEENQGFKLMTDMINMSRVYNAIAAVGGFRRALIEVWQYLNHRTIFGETATDLPMIRHQLMDLGAQHIGQQRLVWRALEAMDRAEMGEQEEAERLRMLTPMAKWWSAEMAVYGVRECMELMGGNGYIEDFIMPKLFRDVNVLPIWEGSGNVIVLDMLRARLKSDGFEFLVKDIEQAINDGGDQAERLNQELEQVLAQVETWPKRSEAEVQVNAKPVFRRFIRLYQIALCLQSDLESDQQAAEVLLKLLDDSMETEAPPSREELETVMGWTYGSQ
ncbi:MAG: acyl-CoA dehydrogenase family protein [Bacteroidota bacterium]